MSESAALRCLPPFSTAARSPRAPPPSRPHSTFPLRSPFPRRRYSRVAVRSSARDPDRAEEDGFGFYPWDPRASALGDSGFQWVPEDKITLFTSDGLIQIGGSLVPRQVPPSDKRQGKSKSSQRYQKFQESNYMDPNQGLCLGALFDIAATNGLDTGRRLCIFGFCRSIEMLSDVVEDIVLEHGGEVCSDTGISKQMSSGSIAELDISNAVGCFIFMVLLKINIVENSLWFMVVAAEKASKGGLHEKLSMIVAVPLLWGIPPASDTLHVAVRSGGGIIEKIYWQWDFL